MTTDNTDEKVRILVNSNSNMSRGKYAAAAVHAALTAAGVHPGLPVIVLGGQRDDVLRCTTIIRDAGKTEVEPGTPTAGTNWAPTPPADDVREALAQVRWPLDASRAPAGTYRVGNLAADAILAAFEVRPRGTATDAAADDAVLERMIRLALRFDLGRWPDEARSLAAQLAPHVLRRMEAARGGPVVTGVVYPTADLDRIWEDHGLPITQRMSAWWEKNILRWGSSAKQGYLAGAKAGLQYVLNLQHQVDNLPVGELLTELRKHEGSIYWPLYSADPKFWAPCPRCHTTVLVDVEGICSECTYEIQETD